MASITSIEDAVKKAKAFLREAGVAPTFCILNDAPIEVDNKWIVKFEFMLTEELYTVELDSKTGKVIGYTREKLPA